VSRFPVLARVAAVALALLLLARNRPAELAARWRTVIAYAPRELATRRLGGSSTAFDRRFFIFLESARRALPRTTPGVAVLISRPSEAALHLAAYQLAPVPVILSPGAVPAGWIAAIYGAERPAGWRVLTEVPGGALLVRDRFPG